MTKHSLAVMRQSVEYLIALYDGDEPDTVIEAAKDAARALGWLERQGELLRMWEKLRRDDPTLFRLFQNVTNTFPGIEVAEVR